MGLFVGLSQLTRMGVLEPGILSNIAIVFYAVLSLQEILMPLPTLTSFGFTDPTALTKALFNGYSTVKFQLGAFVLVSKLTGKHGLGLVGSMAAGVFNCIKIVLSSEETGIDKAGPLVWIVVQGAIAVLAYM